MNFLHKIPIFFWSIFYPIKIYGKENIPSGGAILVCNHFRAMDCGFVARAYDKDIKFLAKKEIFKNKIAVLALSGLCIRIIFISLMTINNFTDIMYFSK